MPSRTFYAPQLCLKSLKNIKLAQNTNRQRRGYSSKFLSWKFTQQNQSIIKFAWKTLNWIIILSWCLTNVLSSNEIYETFLKSRNLLKYRRETFNFLECWFWFTSRFLMIDRRVREMDMNAFCHLYETKK
jgi:hypothetical protein